MFRTLILDALYRNATYRKKFNASWLHQLEYNITGKWVLKYHKDQI